MTPNKAPASFKSIFLRLSVSYTLLAFILTLLSVVLLYYALSHLIHQDNKEFLRSEANTLANIIDQASFPLGENSNLYQEIVLEPTTSKYHYFVRLIDENGNISLQTPKMDETVPAHLFPLRKKSEAVSNVTTVNLSNNREYSLITSYDASN
ncbi:MAG: hypothetical protein GY821_05355 [Gammaproteobacteria bacterium]|nr:hypothetical protein [Gammaproteobacteria bacterium]